MVSLVTKTTVLLDAALSYAKRGWKVFPLEEMGKQPRISVKDGGKGVHDATTDRKQIETWWSRFPNANIGIHCEQFFVLDVDTKSDGIAALEGLIKTYGPLPETLRQRSGSGGTHYLYTAPIGVFIKNSSGFYPGLDTRSWGGYIAVAPSVHPDGDEYSWTNEGAEIVEAPEWLLSLVKDKREGYKQSKRSDSGSRDVDDASLAGYLLNGGLNEDQIFKILQDRNNDPNFRDVPLPTNEIWKTVRSIGKRDVRTPAGLRQAIHENSIRVRTEATVAIKPDAMWEDRMVRSKTLVPKAILANAEAALTHSPLFCNSFAFDELRAETRLTRNIVDPINGKTVGNLLAGAIVDEHLVKEITILAQRLITSVTFTELNIGSALETVARHNRYHPVQDYLNGLVWDEQSRIDTWLIDHLGVEDDADGYARGIGRRWLISAVNRAMKPGCKADCMLIIEGQQGIGKSPALAILAGQEWFKDSPIDFMSKDKFGSVKGAWIYELAEFDQYKSADSATIKSFLSSQFDTYRPPYARSDVKQERGLIFAGTTNKDKYLVDETGNKRFWPVKSIYHNITNPINLKKLQDSRDQIWAEAVRAYYNGAPGFIDMPHLMTAHEKQAALRHDTEDVWEGLVTDYCANKEWVTTSGILTHALGLPVSRQSPKEQARIRRIMSVLDYEYRSARLEGRITKAWRKNANLPLLKS